MRRHDRTLQRNAADEKQIKHAGRKVEERAELFRTSLQAVLAQPAGRFVLWELLTRAGLYRSIWDPSAKIHYNAGRQDYGLELLAQVIDADEELYQLMEREMRAFNRSEARETAAVQTPAANEGE